MPKPHGSKSSMVTVATNGGEMPAMLWQPDTSKRCPGILLIQEIFGINANMRAAGDWLASNGFFVIAPDLFWRIERNIELDPAVAEQREKATSLLQKFDQSAGLSDCRAAIERLRSESQCSGKMGVIGYCLGGKLAFLLAREDVAQAVVAFYPVGVMALDLSSSAVPTSSLLVHLGEQDQLCPPEAQGILRAHLAGAADATVHSYANVGHAFARLGRTGAAEEAAALAERRTIEYLESRLL